MNADEPISPAEVSRELVLSKCDYFVDVQLWPRQSKVNPERWLSNFRDREMDHAVHLLSAFLYYSGDLVVELFKAAFQMLSARIGCPGKPYIQSQALWRSFRKNLIVTYVTGETPSDTDSGCAFARHARQALGIPEGQIMSPQRALETLALEGPRPVVFVDDFVGSGDQCVATWGRETELPDGNVISFQKYSTVRGSSFFYCPVICADLGRQVIQKHCPTLQLSPAHFLSTRYSAVSKESIVWPERLRPTATDFLMSTSKRAGIPEHEWAGYKGLGLTIAFEHSVPDATLPLFYHNINGWHPLVERT